MIEFRVRTTRAIERRDITKEVTAAAAKLGASGDGALRCRCHTTAAVTVGRRGIPT
jgi:thiamine phosphate synthase YjbQ (UPF0047 family)